MVVTVLLTGVPRYVPLIELASILDKFLSSDDVGSFHTRELPRHRSGKRQVALDFKNGFDAMSAQNMLSGYQYQLAGDEREYVLSAKVMMPSPDKSSKRKTPEPPSYSKELVAYGQRPNSTHEELDDHIEKLRKQLIIVENQTKLEKAKKKLKKTKKHKSPDTYSSDSDYKSRHRSRDKRRRKRRSTSSQSSSVSPSRRRLPSTKKARPRTSRLSRSISKSPEPKKKCVSPSSEKRRSGPRTPEKESSFSSISPEPAKKRRSLPSPDGHGFKPRTSRLSTSISKSPEPTKKYVLPSSEQRRSRSKEKRSYENRQISSSVTKAVVPYSRSISDEDEDKSPKTNRNISSKPRPSKRKSRWDDKKPSKVCETPPEKRLKSYVMRSNDEYEEKSLERERRIHLEQNKGDNKPCKKSGIERRDSFETQYTELKMLLESQSPDKQNKSPEKDSQRMSKRTPTPRKSRKSKSSTPTSSDRHVSPYDRRDRKRRRDSSQRRRDSRHRHRDSRHRRRDSPRRRHDSPYRRRDSSRRSHSRKRYRSRSDSPKSSRHYRSPKPSSSRYDATKTAEYLKHYEGNKETLYFSKIDSRRHSYSQSESVFVSRCKQTYSQRALPSATVIEIKDEDVDKLDEILSDSNMDEILSDPKMDEILCDPQMDELNEVVNALTEPEVRPESPPVNRINVEIKVRCNKKNTKDVQKEIDEDRNFLNFIRLGKIPKTIKTKAIPKPIMLDSTGAIKKETPDPEIEKQKQDIEKKKQKKEKKRLEKEKKKLEEERQKQEMYEMIRKTLPKPIIEDTKMIKKELYDINEIIEIDDNEEIRQEKIISPNPKFVLPVLKITKQMKPHTDKVDSHMSEKLCGILTRILRLRIKLLLTDITYYIPSSAITALYRESFSIEEDSELVNNIIADIRAGKFDDFEPNDNEYDKSGKNKVSDDNANIIPYVTGKKKKNDDETEMLTTLSAAVIKKSPDDDVLILEKNIDLIDLSDNKEGNVYSTASATKSSTDMPPEVAFVDGIEIKKEITDIEQEIKEEFDLSEINIEDFNMQLKEEVNMANVTNEPEEQINTQQPAAIDVKTEPDAVISIVKTEPITNDPPVTEEAIADIERSQDVNKTIENIVKPDPDASSKMTENTEQNIVKPDPDASSKMTENTDQNKLDSFVQNVKNKLELVQGNEENHEKTKTQSSSKNTDEKISNKPKETNKPLSKTKHASSKNSDISKKHEDVAKKISSTVKEKPKEKKSKKIKSKEKDENGDRTKTNTKSDSGTEQETSEATNMQTDKENPEQQNIVKEEKVEQEECVETIQDFVSLVTNVVVVD